MWFMIFDKAFDRKYQFKNPNALAAAADYMFNSSRDQSVTKKAIASNYGISPATLTKYVNELIQYLPIFES
jgi:transcription initiation factor TFIIIB Brf1 subunit/transcription initiation factor TFIIB